MEQDGAGVQSRTRRRIIWTNEMNAALLTCKKNAQLLVKRATAGREQTPDHWAKSEREDERDDQREEVARAAPAG